MQAVTAARVRQSRTRPSSADSPRSATADRRGRTLRWPSDAHRRPVLQVQTLNCTMQRCGHARVASGAASSRTRPFRWRTRGSRTRSAHLAQNEHEAGRRLSLRGRRASTRTVSVERPASPRSSRDRRRERCRRRRSREARFASDSPTTSRSSPSGEVVAAKTGARGKRARARARREAPRRRAPSCPRSRRAGLRDADARAPRARAARPFSIDIASSRPSVVGGVEDLRVVAGLDVHAIELQHPKRAALAPQRHGERACGLAASHAGRGGDHLRFRAMERRGCRRKGVGDCHPVGLRPVSTVARRQRAAAHVLRDRAATR